MDQLVIAGPNGGGKTTVLEALLFGLGREDLIVRDLPKAERSGNWRGRIPAGARVSICVRAGGRYLRADRTHGPATWMEVSDPFALPRPTTAEPWLAPGQAPVEYFSSWRAPALVGPVWPTTSGRKAASTESNRLRTIKQRLVDERTLRSYADQAHAAGSEWLDVINEAWRTLHGGDGTTLADQPVTPGHADDGFDLYVLEPDGSRRCTIDQASAGEIEIVCMAGILTIGSFHGVLIIDEPELHLHPQWQARILPTLRALAPLAQIIAASHAEAPWDRAYNYQRYFLAPPGDPRRSDLTPPAELP